MLKYNGNKEISNLLQKLRFEINKLVVSSFIYIATLYTFYLEKNLSNSEKPKLIIKTYSIKP